MLIVVVGLSIMDKYRILEKHSSQEPFSEADLGEKLCWYIWRRGTKHLRWIRNVVWGRYLLFVMNLRWNAATDDKHIDQ